MPEKRGGWTVLDSDVLYANPWITVREDRVVQPDGREGAFGIVEMKPGVSVLPIDDEGQVYLVRVFRYTLDRDCLETIAGGIDEDESPADAARRELREEGGIEAAELIDLGKTDQMTEVVVSPDHLFLARGLSFVESDREPTERIARVCVGLDQALRWVMDGTISHAASAVLIFKAARLLEEGLGTPSTSVR
jgi:8-oxo-dGTP pyrophosphatase MutT (NUDIX family)